MAAEQGGDRGALAPPEVKVGGLSRPPKKKFSGKILIIKEKFRVFLENLGIRGKICNMLFKKLYVREIFLLYVGKNFLLYVWGGGRKF